MLISEYTTLQGTGELLEHQALLGHSHRSINIQPLELAAERKEQKML
jgi:hypothetical protein